MVPSTELALFLVRLCPSQVLGLLLTVSLSGRHCGPRFGQGKRGRPGSTELDQFAGHYGSMLRPAIADCYFTAITTIVAVAGDIAIT